MLSSLIVNMGTNGLLNIGKGCSPEICCPGMCCPGIPTLHITTELASPILSVGKHAKVDRRDVDWVHANTKGALVSNNTEGACVDTNTEGGWGNTNTKWVT